MREVANSLDVKDGAFKPAKTGFRDFLSMVKYPTDSLDFDRRQYIHRRWRRACKGVRSKSFDETSQTFKD